MKTKIFTFLLVTFAVFAINTKILAQVSGDYVATTAGNYNTSANWSISDGGVGTYSGVAAAAPTTAVNVWIPVDKVMTSTAAVNAQDMHIAGELNVGNFTVTLGTSASTSVGNLYIVSGGKLRSSNATAGTVNSLNIFGATIQVNGQLGSATSDITAYDATTNPTGGAASAYNASTNPNGGGGFRIYCKAVAASNITTVTVSGTGTINVARFYGSDQTTAAAPQIVDVDLNINILNNNSAATQAFGSYGNAGGSDRTINVKNGRIVKFLGGTPRSALHREAISAGAYTTGNINYNIYGILDMGKASIKLATSSTTGNAKSTYLNIKSGGTLVLGDTLRLIPGLATGQTCALIVDAGSTVKFSGATTSTIFKNDLGAFAAPFPATFANIVLDNVNGQTYPTSFTVNETLTLTNGKLILGANNLTIASGGSVSGASASSYVVTDGDGALIQAVPAATAKLFPIGTSTTSYDPVALTPASATNFTVKVGTTLTGTAPSGIQYNAKEWNLTPQSVSSTVVTLTPSEITAAGTYNIISIYNVDQYVNQPAAFSTGSYTATYDTFGAFVTGTTDTPTAVKNVTSKVYISVSNNQVFVNGTQAGNIVNVFNINGQEVKQLIANENQTSFNLNSGIYFILVNNNTFKVVL